MGRDGEGGGEMGREGERGRGGVGGRGWLRRRQTGTVSERGRRLAQDLVEDCLVAL